DEDCLTKSSILVLDIRVLQSASLLLDTTERIETGLADFLSLMKIANSNSFSILATLAMGNNMCSLEAAPFVLIISSASLSDSTIIFLAALSVANEATIQVTKIKIMVPFKIFSSKIPARYPTKITANVAAA